MNAIDPDHLSVGMQAQLLVGSPVRQWMRKFRGGKNDWLIPVCYTPMHWEAPSRADAPRYVKVTVARVNQPYVVVLRREVSGWVKLWLDTRVVELFTAEE